MTDVDVLSTVPQASDEPMNDLADGVANVSLTEEGNSPEPATDQQAEEYAPPLRPVVVYTRPQMLFLYRSPLVQTPDGMPALKDWFGDPNLQTLANVPDASSTSGTGRDRRFRRDPEDTDAPARPQFRSTLSQPSQMGNFKHQSLRTGDRDRDRDTDKERDKEGIRNLSDKFDRDRLAQPSNSTLVRNRERDSAPHLSPGTSTRAAATVQVSNGTTRRSDGREGTRRRVGETSDDWRRGAEPLRGVKEDRSDVSRRDRDDRERPRSRVRDSSRSRRDTSAVRGERDRDDRDRDRRTERNGARRDREADKDLEDDPRRWRDDGKRDERMANRRDRDKDRDRDRGRDEWDDRSYDRLRGDRWVPADDKEGRSKRSSGRERRGEETRDRDDRRDRDKEREKEKEPAWMETYVPTTSSGGILGSKPADGELDSIQAWKKEQREKERRERGGDADLSNAEWVGREPGASAAGAPDAQLDEIQLFKLLIKKEEEKRKAGDSPVPGSAAEPGPFIGPKATTPVNGATLPTSQVLSASQTGGKESSGPFSEQSFSTATSTRTDNSPATPSDGPRSLLSIIASGSSESATSRIVKSRGSSEVPYNGAVSAEKGPADTAAFESAPAQFNPPAGSRLLAFGSRNTITGAQSQPLQSHAASQVAPGSSPSHGSVMSASGLLPRGDLAGPSLETPHLGPDAEINFHRGASRAEHLQSQPQFSPFDDVSRQFAPSDQTRVSGAFAQPVESSRRMSVAAERSQYAPTEMASTYAESGGGRTTPLTQLGHGLGNAGTSFEQLQGIHTAAGLNHAAAKGSRFAKFFDSKLREPQIPGVNKVAAPGGGLGMDYAMQRQDQNSMLAGNPESRAMDDIFAMLNNSAQTQRVNHANPMSHLQQSVGGMNNIGLQSIHASQHHQLRQQQQQTLLTSRLDSLPEHRLDDRNFVPDGMVPGLRTAPPPRSRERSGIYMDQLDDQLQVNYQRAPQQRVLEPLFNGSGPSTFPHQGVRNTSLPLQHPQFRGGPSPITSQNPLQAHGQQRIPPGLAHLGGRPPHETSQFIGGPLAVNSGAIPAGLQNNPSPQAFNNLANTNGLNFSGQQMRGMQQSGQHQLQNHLASQNALGLAHSNGLDLRGVPNQPHLTLGGNSTGLRPGFPTAAPQQGLGAHLQAQQLANLRQQQQPAPMSHQALPHMLPPHLQQQGLPRPSASPAANDLMALLMGGPRRE